MQSAIWPSSPSQSIFSLLCPSSPSLPFGPFAGCMFIPRHQIFQKTSRKTNYFSSICSTVPPTRSVRTLSIAAATAASTRASCSPLSVPVARVCAALINASRCAVCARAFACSMATWTDSWLPSYLSKAKELDIPGDGKRSSKGARTASKRRIFSATASSPKRSVLHLHRELPFGLRLRDLRTRAVASTPSDMQNYPIGDVLPRRHQHSSRCNTATS